jgi:hypothetical protein
MPTKPGWGADINEEVVKRQIAAHGCLLERLAAEPHTRLRYFCSPATRLSTQAAIVVPT